jgi:hypothetical protein
MEDTAADAFIFGPQLLSHRCSMVDSSFNKKTRSLSPELSTVPTDRFLLKNNFREREAIQMPKYVCFYFVMSYETCA